MIPTTERQRKANGDLMLAGAKIQDPSQKYLRKKWLGA
jgi:hypothetical protein